MMDITTYCDIYKCEDCPRYGDDCDGDKRVEHTDLISRADAIEAVASITMSIHLSDVICDRLMALPSAERLYTHEEAWGMTDLIRREDAIAYIERVINSGLGKSKSLDYIHKYISALPSAESEQTVYCMDCAKSAPLDEHGALWYCKAHDRTTLRHSYCNNGERKGGQVHYYGKNADIYVIDEHIESEVDK